MDGTGEGPDEGRSSAWRRIVGDGTHLGFWTLPVFVATALAGAVIAGALAQVYYAQQVARLEEETREAREVAETAAAEVEAAREEALAAIAEEVASVRDALEVARPLDDVAAAGVVALRVELAPPPAPSPSPSTAPPADDPSAPTQPGTSPGTGTDDGADGAPLPAPTDGTTAPPRDAAGGTRTGVGFVVSVEGGDVFVATSYGLVQDPFGPDGVAPAVTVESSVGSARGVVHAWDELRHVAVVRVTLPSLPVLPWRPVATPVAEGDVAVLAAVTRSLAGVQLPGRIGAVTPSALITDLPLDPGFDGAPLLDQLGRVVGLQASTVGADGGEGAVIAASELCVELVSGCELLEESDPSDAVSPTEQQDPAG